jgi:hypothetical protein
MWIDLDGFLPCKGAVILSHLTSEAQIQPDLFVNFTLI